MSRAEMFSLDNLAVFERHGAKVTTRAGRAGCHVTLPNGWTLSIQWGPCMYGSNHDLTFLSPVDAAVPPATSAEIAVWPPDGGLVEWTDGDTVQGWCSMERVQHVLDLLAEGNLMRGGDADDGWSDR